MSENTGLQELQKRSRQSGIYQKYNIYINPAHYLTPYGIHGILHAHRVLFLADKISRWYYLTKREKTILGLACCYHDIGRVHDGRDKKHGELSCNKIIELKLLDIFELTTEEKDLILRLIAAHCIEDNSFIGTKRERLLFKILKDADGLDRVRLHDLDQAHLRLVISPMLERLAWRILDITEDA